MNYITRRDVLKGIAAGMVSIPMARLLSPSFLCAEALAQNTEPRYVVVINLQGGLDALGAMPFSTSTSWGAQIASRRPLLPITGTAGYADASLGLSFHSAWNPLYPLFTQGKMKVIYGCGNPRYPLAQPGPEDLSHEFNQTILAMGDANFNQNRGGWLGRALEVYHLTPEQVMGIGTKGGLPFYSPQAQFRPYAVDDLSQLSYATLMTEFGGQVETDKILDAQRRLRAAHLRQHPNSAITQSIGGAMDSLDDMTQFFAAVNSFQPAGLFGGYTSSDAGTGLKGIAKVIGALDSTQHSRIFYTSYNASEWDTHGNQPTALPANIADLATNLAAFSDDLKALPANPSVPWDRVVVITVSEFGRRVFQNSVDPLKVGTDHGTGGVAFAMGGRVNGGVIVDADRIRTANWLQEFYLPVSVHFQNVIGQALNMAGFSSDAVFDPAQYSAHDLQLVRSS